MSDNNLLSSLDKLGLGMLSNMELFEEETKKESIKVAQIKAEEKKKREEDLIFDKCYHCEVCDTDFKSKSVKVGKIRAIGADMDLRPRYEDIDPLKYDAIVCPHCGYAALNRYFTHISATQVKAIRTNITPFFKGIKQDIPIYDYDEAVLRHELALANAVIKKSKASEKAYICIKLAWLKRGMVENLVEDATKDKEAIINKLKAEEKAYIVKAYEGFQTAMSKELFPICGMDQWTFIYLVSELGYECEDYTISMKLLSDLVVSKEASSKLKDKARELRKLMQNKI